MDATRTCTVDACERPHKGRGLCDMHLQRLRRTGTTASPVRSQEERFWEKVDVRGPNECWPWTAALTSTGYGALRPTGKRSGPVVKAHRYSAELAGMDISGKSVLHSCDNPPCCNPAHLRPGNDADNMADALSRGRVPVGTARRTARLTEQQVREIDALAAEGVLHRVIAERYGVSRSTITRAVNRTGWKHVTPPAARDLIAAVASSLEAA